MRTVKVKPALQKGLYSKKVPNLLKPVPVLHLEGLTKDKLTENFLAVTHRYTNFFELFMNRDLKELPKTVGGTPLTRSTDRAYYIRAEPLRHPLIFYLGHTSSVYINKLIISGLIKDEERIDKWLEARLAVGVDEMSWDDKLHDLDQVTDGPDTDPQSEVMAWPTVRRVFEFRKKLEEKMLHTIEKLDMSTYNPRTAHRHPVWSILMGIEHENIHLETSAPILRQLPLECVNKVSNLKIAPFTSTSTLVDLDKWVNVKGKHIKIGSEWSSVPESYKHLEKGYYSWDNENGSHEMDVQDFKMRKYLITNGEYKQFVESGGYANPKFWPKEAKGWPLAYKHPRWWIKNDNGQWDLRLMDRVVALPDIWPAEVNHHESVAYINWYNEKHGKKYRLPTEDEWHVVNETPAPQHAKTISSHANVDLNHFHTPAPVDMFKHASGIHDLTGNLWNWTCTDIYPFKNFTVHSYYDDFTLPTFDGRHSVFKGGSWISCGNEALPWSRYAFRRHFYQFAGVRMVQGPEPPKIDSNPYENDKLVCGYINFHYSDVMNELKVPNFCVSIAEEIWKVLKNRVSHEELKKWNVLDLGCGPGRLTFELARKTKFALGIDYSVRFMQVAHLFRDAKKIAFNIPEEGELTVRDEIMFETKNLQNTHFIQCDAHNLPRVTVDANGDPLDCSHFNMIVCANLIDRLRAPKDVLKYIATIQKKGDWLFLLSPYTWMEEWTDKKNWIGGFYQDGKSGLPLTTFEGLKIELEGTYELLSTCDVPFLLREHARKFQYSKSHFTAWKRK